MPLTIVRQDITKMEVDAIVNAANTNLWMGGGVCGAIFRAAGEEEMQKACAKVAPIKTGGAAITPGFALPAKYVIHAAGPVYQPWSKKACADQLRSAYLESLKLAAEHHLESIAFPLISSGIYGYPKAEALQVATSAIADFLLENDMDIYLAVYDKDAFAVSSRLMGPVAAYIDAHYVEEHDFGRSRLLDVEERALQEAKASRDPQNWETDDFAGMGAFPEAQRDTDAVFGAHPMETSAGASLTERVENLEEPFSAALFRMIDTKGKTDVEVYKRANIDRKLFSKIRSVQGYTPKKSTILALAIALELSLGETDALLERAGYALSHASKFDVIVEYFIINKNYNIFDINEVLFQSDQPLLGG